MRMLPSRLFFLLKTIVPLPIMLRKVPMRNRRVRHLLRKQILNSLIAILVNLSIFTQKYLSDYTIISPLIVFYVGQQRKHTLTVKYTEPLGHRRGE